MAMTLGSEPRLAQLLRGTPYPVRQALLGTAYLLVPRRLPNLVPLALLTLRGLPTLRRPSLPDLARVLDRPDGLCGFAGPIGVAELLEGYRCGAFVMSHIGPLKWWAPRHRMVLFFDQARIEKGTRRLLRNGKYRVTMDAAFDAVVSACAAPRDSNPLTWITPRIKSLFRRAHQEGHAHSVEVWDGERLVAGAYGLAAGRVFFTESQFHAVRDGSKLAFAVLNRHLQAWGFALNDGKHVTRYLADCGMQPITRTEFSSATETFGCSPGRIGRWQVEPALIDGGWEPGESAGLTLQDVLPGGSHCRFSVTDLLAQERSNTW